MAPCTCKRSFGLLLASLAFASVSAQSTAVDWGAAQECNVIGEGNLRPRMAILENGNPIVLWGRSSPPTNFVSTSTGDSFLPAVEVSMPGAAPSVADWMGSSIATSGSASWVVMKTQPETSSPVYVRRSNDGGLTWGDTIRVEPNDGRVARFPTLIVTDPDAPVVQYMQFDQGWAGARQVTTRMVGGAFSTPVEVSAPFAPGEVCDCCPGQLVGAGDRAVALYRNAGSNIRVMYGAASQDGGATFPTGALLDETGWLLNACPSSGPAGYMAGDSVRYVWMSGATNGSKTYIGSAHASDLSLGAQGLVHPGLTQAVTQNFPRIAGSNDTLGVVWQQTAGSQNEILFSWSVTGVNGLSVPDTVNVDLAGIQRTPDIAYANGAFHIIWSDMASATVRYRKATLNAVVGVEERAYASTLIWPNPVVDQARISGSGWSSAVITDLHGRTVMERSIRNGQVDLSTLAAGSYLMQLIDGKQKQAPVRFEKR